MVKLSTRTRVIFMPPFGLTPNVQLTCRGGSGSLSMVKAYMPPAVKCSDWFGGLVPTIPSTCRVIHCSASRRRPLDPFQNLGCPKVFVPPASNVAEQFAKVESFFRESVSATPPIGRVGHFLDKPVLP